MISSSHNLSLSKTMIFFDIAQQYNIYRSLLTKSFSITLQPIVFQVFNLPLFLILILVVKSSQEELVYIVACLPPAPALAAPAC